MAIDPRIAMGFQMPEQPSRLGMAANALQLKNMLMQGQMQEAEMASKRAELERQTGIRNFLQTTDVNTPEGMAAFRKAYPMEAPKIEAQMLEPQIKRAGLEKDQAQAKKYGTDAQAAEFKLKQDKVNQNLQLLGSVQTPEQAAQWVSAGVTQGLLSMEQAQAEISKIPRDPQGFAQWKQGQQAAGMTISQQMEQMWKAKEFGYRQQNDEANRKVTIRGQDVSAATTRRGQDMTDARAREVTDVVKKERDLARKAEGVDKAVTKFSDTLQKEGVPDLETALATAEGSLNRYKPGEVPGVGRLAGAVPSMLLSNEGNDVRQAVASLRNIVLSARSGAAVTDQELRRLVEELGTGPGQSEDALRRGVAKVRARIDKIKENAAAGVTDDVLRTYRERGGLDIKRGGATAPNLAVDEALKLYGGR